MKDIEVAPANCKILIVDDDPSFNFLVAEALLSNGFDIEQVNSGIECLEKITAISPDIIILDVLMPQLNGYETCKSIRKLVNFALTPILMMTGLDDEDSIQTAYLAGATDFISKPFSFNLFLQRVNYIFRNSRQTNELIKTERRLAEATKLAKLSYWEWDCLTGNFAWSATILNILQLEKIESTNSFEFLLKHVPIEEKKEVENWINDAKKGTIKPSITHRFISSKNKTLYIRQQMAGNYDEKGNLLNIYGSLHDVTDIHKAQYKIRKLAYYDSLTDLPNREYFNELLTQAIRIASREKRIVALLFIGLDNFQRVNDLLGHNNGDILLKSLSSRIKKCIRISDVAAHKPYNGDNLLARLGGDEFTILLTETNDYEGAAVVAQRIIDALAKPFNINGNDIITTPSIGISVFPEDSNTGEQCLINSSIAMNHAKRSGKNNFCYFNHDMNLEIINKAKIENAMRTALNDDEFKLEYQPQINLKTNKMNGVEALIRWHSATLGLVPPDKFIKVAEENGMIIQIGYWALKEACRQAKQWIDEGIEIKRVSVNVSSRQFSQMNFDKLVKGALIETCLPAHFLDLEMTESMLMSHADKSLDTLDKLKKIGIGLSIDDFGTGYSSLAYLSQFPIDHLKIDKSFIDDVHTNPNNKAIVSAVIAMANTMGMRITAEGVELTEQLEHLTENEHLEIQGYLFSKPLPPKEIPKFSQYKPDIP